MRILPSITGALLYAFYRALCSTLRISLIGREPVQKVWESPSSLVFAFWHAEFLPLLYMGKEFKSIAMASASQDGDYLEAVLTRIGFEVARGSSSRKGIQALLRVVRRLKSEPFTACIAIDGPRGPRHVIKPGALFIAARAGVPIVPLRVCMERAYIFKSWDRFQLPLPFSKVHIVFGEPYYIPPAYDEASMAIAIEELKARMDAADAQHFVSIAGEKKCQ